MRPPNRLRLCRSRPCTPSRKLIDLGGSTSRYPNATGGHCCSLGEGRRGTTSKCFIRSSRICRRGSLGSFRSAWRYPARCEGLGAVSGRGNGEYRPRMILHRHLCSKRKPSFGQRSAVNVCDGRERSAVTSTCMKLDPQDSMVGNLGV